MKANLIAIILLVAGLVCADQGWGWAASLFASLLIVWCWCNWKALAAALCLCASVVQSATFSAPPVDTAPSPQSALQRLALRSTLNPQPSTLTNGRVMLLWTAGESAQTVVNFSNQTATAVGLADIATISGLAIGSTNTFVVTNATGASNLATGVATRGTNRITQLGTITIYGADRVAGKTNWLLTSSNLVTWTRAVNLGTTAGRSTFLVTNGAAGQQYYQTLAE